MNTIAGFNRTVAMVVSIRQGDKKIGCKFECTCGTVKKYMTKFFHDTHHEAVAALNSHRCHV